MNGEPQRFVTIEYFIKEMMGYKNKASYYNHLNDEGWPQRIYNAGGKPMLVYSECIAFQEMLMKRGRLPDAKPFEKRRLPPLPDGQKRHAGRPAKAQTAT